eukprot:909677_1
MRYKSWSDPMKKMKTLLKGRVTVHLIQNMSNWKDASEVLSAVGAMMLINISSSQALLLPIDDDILKNAFARITDPKVYGSMQNILKNIGLVFEDYTGTFQTSCWKFQARYPGLRQFHYLLWYNLLCCVTPDVFAAQRKQISTKQDSITLGALQKLIDLDNRLNKFKQPHPFAKQKRNIIMTGRTTTIQDCISLIHDIADIDSVYDFIKRYTKAIRNILGENTDLYIKFASEILNRLLKSKQKKAEKRKQLQQSIIHSLKTQMPRIRTQNEVKTFYDFYTKYRQFMIGSGIDTLLIKYELFIEYRDFIPIFA